jgi:hypothetical protein
VATKTATTLSLLQYIHSGRQDRVRSLKAGHGSGVGGREGHCRSRNRRDHDLQSQGTGCVERESAGELLSRVVMVTPEVHSKDVESRLSPKRTPK